MPTGACQRTARPGESALRHLDTRSTKLPVILSSSRETQNGRRICTRRAVRVFLTCSPNGPSSEPRHRTTYNRQNSRHAPRGRTVTPCRFSVPLNRSSPCGSIIKTCSGFAILAGRPQPSSSRQTSHGGVSSPFLPSFLASVRCAPRNSTARPPAAYLRITLAARSQFAASITSAVSIVSSRVLPYLFRDSVGLILIRGPLRIRMRHDGN